MLVIGLDSAKDRVDAVSMYNGLIMAPFTIDLAKEQRGRGETLGSLRQQTEQFIELQEHSWGERATVFVEEPIMMRSIRVAIMLAETVGMLLALPYPVYEVPIDSWKKVLAGKGGIDKQAVRTAITHRFPEAPSIFGVRQDLFDAAGVAFYGSKVLGRRLD